MVVCIDRNRVEFKGCTVAKQGNGKSRIDRNRVEFKVQH